MDNNILNSDASVLSVYQEKSEKWELYQEINNFWVETKKECRNCGSPYSHNNKQLKNKNSSRHFGKSTGCRGLID